jgi:peptide/nickel transport system permease protein
VLIKHVLRNALIPIITVIAIFLPGLLGGAVVVEQIFAWPGMGQLAVTAVTRQDNAVIIAFALLVSILVLLSNLLADLLYAVVDPRVVLK